MSVGPSGMIGSLAGTPAAQAKGTEAERAQQESANQARQIQADTNAERAEGVGETSEDEEVSERDADGRRMWERPQNTGGTGSAMSNREGPVSRDASGLRGNQLELSG